LRCGLDAVPNFDVRIKGFNIYESIHLRQRAYSGRLLLSAAECGYAPAVVRLAAAAPGADVNATNEVSRRERGREGILLMTLCPARLCYL
jgi:hypothetical protein